MREDFLWGAATSSHQIEGNNIYNDWWRWEQQGHTEGGARSGRATDHWNRFREDLGLAAELGLNSYRFSVEWSRIEREEGRFDEAALDWYEELVAECERQGLLPMLTLHHFTSPVWFADQGGFTSPDAHVKFASFAKKVAQRLGARVPLWCTLNEPMVLVAGTYLGNFMPPGKFSPRDASRACAGLLRSHVAAYDVLHAQVTERKGPWRTHKLGVGIAHNMLDFMADRSWHPIERALAFVFWRFYNQAWLDAITGRRQIFGVPGLVPYASQVSEARGRKTADFLGVNYYTKAYVRWRPRQTTPELPAEIPMGLEFARGGEPASDLKWAVHPTGFGKVLRFAGRYGLPIYVTENGIADATDSLRPGYIRSHLEQLEHARIEGVDVRGYYHWSLLDNFEWHKGFWPRFGLYRVNYDTLERQATGSAQAYKEWIAQSRKRP